MAVIDSGIDTDLPALKGKMWNKDGNGTYGYDFREDEPLTQPPPSDLHHHGTFVAGLLASNYDEATGAGGVSPNISIMDLEFLDEDGKFYTSDWDKLADAVDYAVDNGTDIINMSLYASLNPPNYVQEAVKRAESNGVLVVGIAGNDGAKTGYFANWGETFTVDSVNRSKSVSYFSNYGSEVDLVAPGEKQSYLNLAERPPSAGVYLGELGDLSSSIQHEKGRKERGIKPRIFVGKTAKTPRQGAFFTNPSLPPIFYVQSVF